MNRVNGILPALDWHAVFGKIYPGFFEDAHIRSLPEYMIYDEMAMDLKDYFPDERMLRVPGSVSFGFYTGSLEVLRNDIKRVDKGWPELYNGDSRIYCAFEDGELVSFCMLEDMGIYEGLRIGGPGCVGTLPEHRRRGIGLKLVQNATSILKQDGYGVSYIHYTGVAEWYASLGYRTVLRWNSKGFV